MLQALDEDSEQYDLRFTFARQVTSNLPQFLGSQATRQKVSNMARQAKKPRPEQGNTFS